jgi:hypothetical protein
VLLLVLRFSPKGLIPEKTRRKAVGSVLLLAKILVARRA